MFRKTLIYHLFSLALQALAEGIAFKKDMRNTEVFIMWNINGKKMGTAFFVISILIGMALFGNIVPTEAEGKLAWDPHIVDSVSLETEWTYNTSAIDVDISYVLNNVNSSWEFSNLNISLMKVGSMAIPTQIYGWNSTLGTIAPQNPYTWSLDGTQEVGDWIINVTADYYNKSSGEHNMGWKEAHFQVLDGTHMIGDISADPEIVENGGSDMVNISYFFNREFDELDTGSFQVMIYNTVTMESHGLQTEEPDPENITVGDHNSTAFYHLLIPEDTPVGTYAIFMNASDEWGYSEIWNETLFEVVWNERPPEMVNDTIYLHEDGFEVIDLDDHFEDVNGQDLMFYINMSQFENLIITWEDEAENHINVSAAEHWDEPETFDLNVTDGIDMPGHNVTFTMTVNVMPVEDPLMPAEDVTIEIAEDVKEAMFNPQDLFYDPDGPVENLAVSLGWEWTKNETNVSVMTPIWTWTDGNFSVSINDSDNTNAMAEILADLEEGSAEFPISAWINGTPILNATAMVEIVPVNDVPMPASDTITLFMNEAQTLNLSELFVDPDSEILNFTVNDTMTEDVDVQYDWMTHLLTLTPAENVTGTTTFMVNATDGIDYGEYTMNVEVILRSFNITGTIDFQDVDGVEVNISNVTFMIGDNEVVLDENGTFSITLEQGDYEVTLTIPDGLLYSESAERSGYEMPKLAPINLTDTATYDVSLTYKTYEEPAQEASWADLDFENVEFDDDDDLTVILPVKEGSENKSGWNTFVVKLVIVESDDEELNFTMDWDSAANRFTVKLNDDDLEDLGDGKKEYYFINDDATEESGKEKYEFKSEDENAGPMTIIILVALILLVLVALIFIMRKPSEEDFDEDEEDEEEDGRTCPGCGESVTDDEAEECPYCGEDLEE
jgi:hypothetical protein